ncbi:MAG: tetratricopeptide repeat protein, partial [Thermodesulfobacteriota bacterium]|nr:tetratricopeptide repeat protein [Thermodesulfobacteriota bacterium]
VLDISGSDFPHLTTMSKNNRLNIYLRSKKIIPVKKGNSTQVHGKQEKRVSPAKETPIKVRVDDEHHDTASIVPALRSSGRPNGGGNHQAGKKKIHPPNMSPPKIEVTGQAADRQKQKTIGFETNPLSEDRGNSSQALSQKAVPEKRLVEIPKDDGRDDTAFFLKGMSAYRDQDWSVAIKTFKHLIKMYPAGRYTEKSYFLLAKAYDQFHSNPNSTHFMNIRSRYEDAINKYPTSIYAQDALLAIASLFFKAHNNYEALAYCNLVIKRDENSDTALKAIILKARILVLKKRRKEALSILEKAVDRYQHSSVKTEAKKEMAKILHHMNKFRRSLHILIALIKDNPENIYRYPEISLYLGNNYYQLEDHTRARKNLFIFYNTGQDKEISHLILARIGDTYRKEGLKKDAEKIYQLVLDRHPKTEGAVISRLRLAELKEKKGREGKNQIISPVRVVGKETGSAAEIYKDIVNNPSGKNETPPLAQLAMLKLAILHQKDKDYDKSLRSLKEFLNKYSLKSLRKEGKHALIETVRLILKEEEKRERYIQIINFFHNEKKLFSIIKDPAPFLIVARAYLHLDLEDMATDIYNMADPLMAKKEKPPDLLFFLGSDLFEKEALESALKKLDLLIENYPSDLYASRAYHLKGKIHAKQKRFQQAVEMFTSALRFNVPPCKRAHIYKEKAHALIEDGHEEDALTAIKDADQIKGNCKEGAIDLYRQIGELYLTLNYPREAISVFNQALGLEKGNENKVLIKIKIAQCYRLLNKEDDSLGLYDQISGLKDPFWSILAREKIEEINFNREINEIKKR